MSLCCSVHLCKYRELHWIERFGFFQILNLVLSVGMVRRVGCWGGFEGWKHFGRWSFCRFAGEGFGGSMKLCFLFINLGDCVDLFHFVDFCRCVRCLCHVISRHQRCLDDGFLKVIQLYYLNQAEQQIYLHLNNYNANLFKLGLNSKDCQYFLLNLCFLVKQSHMSWILFNLNF